MNYCIIIYYEDAGLIKRSQTEAGAVDKYYNLIRILLAKLFWQLDMFLLNIN